jgi:hypothetical protein
MKRRGEAGSWDCKEWADSTKKPFKKLPESKPMTEKEAFDNMVRVKTALYKLQSIFEKVSALNTNPLYQGLFNKAGAGGDAFVPPPAGTPQPKLMHGPSGHPAVLNAQRRAQAAKNPQLGQAAGRLSANSLNSSNLQQESMLPTGLGMVPHAQRNYPVGLSGPGR